ncbi:MAG: hypothetical protein QM758_28945 [Armatimonas sp.]
MAKSVTHVIPIPKTWEMVYPQVSPAGDKIAWDVYVCDTEQATNRQGSKPVPAQWTHCLMISDLKGKGMRLLISNKADQIGGEKFFDDNAEFVGWMPDGEHLCFIRGGDVFTVPAQTSEGK